MKNLLRSVQQNATYFTPYLGLSQFTAQIKFVDVCQANLMQSEDFEEIISAINLSELAGNDAVQFNYESGKYTSDTMPIELQRDRIAKAYAEVLLETNGKPVPVKLKK